MKTYLKISLCFVFLCASVAASAKDYMVEVILFKNLSAQQAFESLHYVPPAELISASEYWLIEEPTMLVEQAALIDESSDYELIEHFSWGQESLPHSESTAFPLAQDEVNGWIKVYANHLLYINIDLDVSGYRMDEKRRIKLDERHFFDHPKFGLLVQVSRLEPEETSSAELSDEEINAAEEISPDKRR